MLTDKIYINMVKNSIIFGFLVRMTHMTTTWTAASVCVLFRGKRGTVCGKRLTFLYTSPYEHVEYNVSGP